jgi:predicted membrane protein
MRTTRFLTYLVLVIGLIAHLWMAHENSSTAFNKTKDTFLMFALYSIPFLMHFVSISSIHKIGFTLVSTLFAVTFTLFLIYNYYLHGGDQGFWPFLIGLPVNLLVAAINFFRTTSSDQQDNA